MLVGTPEGRRYEILGSHYEFLLVLWLGSPAKEVTLQIQVKGIKCDSCVATVKKALTETNGVRSVEVKRCSRLCFGLGKGGVATVVYDDSQVSEEELRQAINQSGFKDRAAKRAK